MKKLRYTALILIAIFCTGCELFERDLTKDTIKLIAPANGSNVINLTNTFWWEELEPAKTYRLQIASPDFSSPQALHLDTLVGSNQFQHTLEPGTYEWRVRAENNSSYTPYTTNQLTIDSTNDLTAISLQLYQPVDNNCTNDSSLTFSWQNLYNATSYTFRILENGNLKYSTTTSYDTLTVDFSAFGGQEGMYTWQVKAENQFSSTLFTSRTVHYDFQNPGVPQLLSPGSNVTRGDSMTTFSWQRGGNAGCGLQDSFQVSNDSSNWSVLKVGRLLTDSTSTDSLGSGTWYWRVRSFDQAGNKGAYSIIRKLTIL